MKDTFEALEYLLFLNSPPEVNNVDHYCPSLNKKNKRMNRLTFMGIIVLLFTIGCKSSKEYPDSVRQNFIASCSRNSDGKTELCNCLFEKLKENYSFEEYIAIEEQVKAGQTPQDFLSLMDKASLECNEQIK